ncbi:MAG: alanine racemase [Treponemataceae bacterium]
MYATRAIIHLDRFEHNLQQVRSIIPSQTKICVPVKADAYGHGAVQIAQYAKAHGAELLAVANVHEGIELRQANISGTILCFGTVLPDEIPLLFDYKLTPFVFDAAFISLLTHHATKEKQSIDVHLKIDTGMARCGCDYTNAHTIAKIIAQQKNLHLAGVATHFACADSTNPNDISYTQLQLTRFDQSVNNIRKEGVETGLVHAANSGATILHPQSHFDMVRPGLILYGYLEKSLAQSKNHKASFKPVMEIYSTITSIKMIEKGDFISYGRTWQADKKTLIATVPMGYADGLNRALSNNFEIGIHGKSYPVVGRICMDQCLVDIGLNSEIQVFDEVCIMGDKAPYSTQSLAEKLHTIPYEITCSINKRVKRIYSTNGK